MTEPPVGGGTKILRGLLIAVLVVAVIVLSVVFWEQTMNALRSAWTFVEDRIPGETNGRVAVLVYLILAAILGVIFSKAGHFTAYGVAMGLIPLLWLLFWRGFPPLGLEPTWTTSMNLDTLSVGHAVLWGVVADIIFTLVFVPLELSEKYRRRKVRLGEHH